VRANPCPSGSDRGSIKRCRGYVIDHICPLVCCGLDASQNMQWQTVESAKAKDAVERNCSACGPALPAIQKSSVSSTGDTITVQVIDGIAPLDADAVLYAERRGPFEIARRETWPGGRELLTLAAWPRR